MICYAWRAPNKEAMGNPEVPAVHISADGHVCHKMSFCVFLGETARHVHVRAYFRFKISRFRICCYRRTGLVLNFDEGGKWRAFGWGGSTTGSRSLLSHHCGAGWPGIAMASNTCYAGLV
jgi:hypothetical protein